MAPGPSTSYGNKKYKNALQSHKNILFQRNQAMCWLLDQTTFDQFKHNYVNSQYRPKQILTLFPGHTQLTQYC
jgi:hypothetical protein